MFVWNENEEIRKRKEREKSEKRKEPVSRARAESRNRKGKLRFVEPSRKARHEIWSGQAGDVGGLGLGTQKRRMNFGILENAMKTHQER